MIFIIGGRGRLAQAIRESYRDQNAVSLERHIYQDWWKPGSEKTVCEFFSRCSDTDSVVFVTAGILDPSRPQEEHDRVNFLLPKRIIECAATTGIRIVTFGTVMERLIANNNPYIRSKSRLSDYIAGVSEAAANVVHLRLHTLFGVGTPNNFMFLGQIFRSLMNQEIFAMSPGNQLREYHHVRDEAHAIRTIVEARMSGVIDLSHGEALSLERIARYIFKEFDCEDLLRIGALPEPDEDNFGTTFKRPDILKKVKFRKSLPAIVDYLRSCSPLMEKSV